MIEGILIFMSFSSSIFIGNIPSEVINRLSNPNLTDMGSQNASMQSYLEQSGLSSQVYFTVLTLIPFAGACLIIGYYDYKHDEDDESEKRFRNCSILCMLIGFGMLIAILVDLLLRNTFD